MPSRTQVLVPTALEKPVWQHGRAILIGIFLHFIISPRSDGLARSAGGWETVQEQRVTLEMSLEKLFPLPQQARTARGEDPGAPRLAAAPGWKCPPFWGDTREVTLSLLAATRTSAHIPQTRASSTSPCRDSPRLSSITPSLPTPLKKTKPRPC